MRFVAAAVVSSALILTPLRGVAAETASGAVPAVIAQATSFRGGLSYSARRADDPSVTISGSLFVDARGFMLDERSPDRWVHVSSGRSWMRTDSGTVFFDDPFPLDALANSWAAMVATSAGATLSADPGGLSWSTDSGIRLYLDAGRTTIEGLTDLRSESGLTFAYADFVDLGGVRAPRSVVRMRGGAPDGSYIIDDYHLTPSQPAEPAQAGAGGSSVLAPAAASSARATVSADGAWRWSTVLALLLAAALGVAAWLRKDVLVERLTRRLALDPRAWRSAATTIMVSPEGMIWFQGRPYRVGAHFYNRQALIQTSPLFVRISAAETSRILILARKFPLPAGRGVQWRLFTDLKVRGYRALARRARGFTLLETLAASTLFAAVIISVVVPALIVLAHADRLAAQRQHALQVAANALTDEQAALAYEPSSSATTITDETKTAMVEGLALTETVAPAAVSGLHSLAVEVRDPSGALLARIVTQVGPPVPAPGAHSGGSGGESSGGSGS